MLLKTSKRIHLLPILNMETLGFLTSRLASGVVEIKTERSIHDIQNDYPN